MLITTRLTKRLGIAHPVLLAPMDAVSGAGLTAAVTEAGGLGILGGGYGDEQWLGGELDQNFDIAAVIAGESAGLVHDVLPASEVVQRTVRDAATLLKHGVRHVQVEA